MRPDRPDGAGGGVLPGVHLAQRIGGVRDRHALAVEQAAPLAEREVVIVEPGTLARRRQVGRVGRGQVEEEPRLHVAEDARLAHVRDPLVVDVDVEPRPRRRRAGAGALVRGAQGGDAGVRRAAAPGLAVVEGAARRMAHAGGLAGLVQQDLHRPVAVGRPQPHPRAVDAPTRQADHRAAASAVPAQPGVPLDAGVDVRVRKPDAKQGVVGAAALVDQDELLPAHMDVEIRPEHGLAGGSRRFPPLARRCPQDRRQ